MENNDILSLNDDKMTHEEKIICRVEHIILSFLQQLSHGVKGESSTFSPIKSEEKTNYSDNSLESAEYPSVSSLLPPLSVRSIRRTATRLAVLHSVIKLHAENGYATLRQIYYCNTDIATNQRNIDAATAVITQFLKEPRETLRISSSAKGIIRGPVILQERSSNSPVMVETNCWHPLEKRGHLLSSSGVLKVVHASKDVKFILVVEKETIFYSLLEQQFIEKHGPCILLTGKGFPDICSRNILHQLNKYYKEKVLIYLLGDYDPHGYLIAITYAFNHKSNHSQFYFGDYSVPNAILLPLPSAEELSSSFSSYLSNIHIGYMNTYKQNILKGIDERLKKIEEKYSYQIHPNWRRQLNKLKRSNAIYTLDVLKDLPRIIMQGIEEELGCIDTPEEEKE